MTIAIFWGLILLCAMLPLRWSVYLFFVSISFGSFNTLPLSFTVLPSVVCACLLLAKTLRWQPHPHAISDALLNWRRLGLLSCFLLVAAAVTFSAPVLFHGVQTIGLNTAQPTPLALSAANGTQLAYLLISAGMVLVCYLLMLDARGRVWLAQGLLLGGATLVITGALSMVLPGEGGPLAIFRNATYSIMADSTFTDIAMTRVVGLQPEASSYGGATLGFAAILLMLRPARMLGRRWAVVEALLGIALLGFTVLSTSSGAYVGLALLVGLLVVRIMGQAVFGDDSATRRAHQAMLVGLGAVAGLAAVYLLCNPALLARIYAVLDTIVLQKTHTDSYIERSSWNRGSMAGLAQTYGYGLGVGSTRPSSWLVAVMASTGLIGAGLMAAFVVRAMMGCAQASKSVFADMGRQARWAWGVMLVPALGAGTSVDFGYEQAILFAMMAVAPLLAKPEDWHQQSDAAPARWRDLGPLRPQWRVRRAL